MSSLLTSSSVSNPSGFALDMEAMERDIVNAQLRREAELLIQQREDAARCTGCGDPTEGTKICGSHVRVCPACLAAFVERETASALAMA
jgi:hypothetical protein